MLNDSAEYKAIAKRYMDIAEAELKRDHHAIKMTNRILELCYPLKTLNVSKLRYVNPDRLMAIGKAARALHDEFAKVGIVQRDVTKYNHPDFDL